MKTLSVPLTIRYSLPIRKFSGFVQLGAYFEYHLEAEGRVLLEKLIGTEVFSRRETSLPIRKNQVGVMEGLGLIKPFNAFTGNLVVRYAQVTTPNQIAGIVHNGRQLVLSLILLKR